MKFILNLCIDIEHEESVYDAAWINLGEFDSLEAAREKLVQLVGDETEANTAIDDASRVANWLNDD